MFICMPKINFMVLFFLEILHFKKSCNLIGWQHFGPLPVMGLVVKYHFRLFPRNNDKIFQKIQKPYFGLLLPKSGHKWIFPEKVLSVSRYSNYLPSCQKSDNYWDISVKNVELSNCRTDELTDGRTDGRTDRQMNGDFIEPSVGRGSNKCEAFKSENGRQYSSARS